MNSIIKLNNVSYSYNDNGLITPVLQDLDLIIDQGESVAILGQSGCGKSTLLNLIGGMSTPDKGEVLINNIDITELNENKTTEIRSKNLGFVYQFHHLLKDFTALDNVAMPLLIQGYSKTESMQKSVEILDSIGLSQRIDHLPAQLSGGERQRVAIARALITNPICLLADEPTGNLDAKNAIDVLDLMIKLNHNKNSALVVVTHDEKIAKKMQRILVMEGGKLNEC